MTTSLLLAFALIQAPAAAPQDFQLATLSAEPVLAKGIKVEVVEAPGVEVEAEALPISPVSFAGVVPPPRTCAWALHRCFLMGGPNDGAGSAGYEGEMLWSLQRAQDREFRDYNVGYQRGHAAAEAKAALARAAASARSSGTRGRSSSGAVYSGSSSSGGSSSGGGSASGSSGGKSGAGSTTGSPLSRGRME